MRHPLPLKWSGHPARRSPSLTVVLVAVVTLSGLLAMRLAGPLVGFLGIVCMLGAVGRFLVPAEYTVDEDGIRVERGGAVRHRPWKELKRWVVRGDWLLLSPFERPHLLDERRGLLLDMVAAPDELTLRVAEHLGEASKR